MSAVLLLTAGTGPAEGLLLQDLRDSGHVVDVLDVASHAWLRRRPGLAPAPLYPWTGTHAPVSYTHLTLPTILLV